VSPNHFVAFHVMLHIFLILYFMFKTLFHMPVLWCTTLRYVSCYTEIVTFYMMMCTSLTSKVNMNFFLLYSISCDRTRREMTLSYDGPETCHMWRDDP